MRSVTRQEVGAAMAELIPDVIRGVQLEFFVGRGVTQTQLLALIAIHAYGQVTMGQLARSLQVRMPTMTGIVQRLTRGRYLQRMPGCDDRRQVVVRLTAKGRMFIQEFQGVIRHRWERVLRVLDPLELEAFYHVVTKLKTRLRTQPDPTS